jgi:hypothetical protein
LAAADFSEFAGGVQGLAAAVTLAMHNAGA